MRFINAYFGAPTAIDAVFSPLNLKFVHIIQIKRYYFRVNVIFLWHNLKSIFQKEAEGRRLKTEGQ
jgi:hypothetical protein